MAVKLKINKKGQISTLMKTQALPIYTFDLLQNILFNKFMTKIFLYVVILYLYFGAFHCRHLYTFVYSDMI